MHADNVDAVVAFIYMRTQWRAISGMRVVFLGLDYVAVPTVLDMMNVTEADRRRAIFDDLRTMESVVLPILNAPKEAEA